MFENKISKLYDHLLYYVIETLMYYLNNYYNFVKRLKHIFYEFCFKLYSIS